MALFNSLRRKLKRKRYRLVFPLVVLLLVTSLIFGVLALEATLRFNWTKFQLEVLTNPSIATTNEDPCFSYGTSFAEKNGTCVCLDGWFGKNCSVPEAIWTSPHFKAWYSKGLIRRRARPRSIINGFVINHEMDMLEIRVKELGDAVDYFLACESNYTYFGMPKPLHLRSNLSAGFLSEHRHKIVTLVISVYNVGDGSPWAPEDHFRSSIWKEGRHHFSNIREDDLFMITDADEIPRRDVMLFLKHHDGFGEPIALTLRSFIYGFFWESKSVNVRGICTVGYLRDIYQNDSLQLRRWKPNFHRFSSNETGTIRFDWTIRGMSPSFAGWHCSWCFNEIGIQVKLASAQRDDGVRWGDIAEKTELAYISSLRKSGKYFDNSTPAVYVDALSAAPAVLKENSNRWHHLLFI